MYKIIFYEDSRGHSVADYINKLRARADNDKSSRIRLRKIVAYIDKLAEQGTFLGQPFVKRLDEMLWELRPINNRIIFAVLKEEQIILLHIFVKKSKKTPQREIVVARNHLIDYLERTKNENMG